MMYKRFRGIIERVRAAANCWQDMYDPLLDILLPSEVSEILFQGQILYKYLRLSNTGECQAAEAEAVARFLRPEICFAKTRCMMNCCP